MIEIALVAVIFILCGFIGWQDFQNRKERKSLLNMLKSKDAIEFSNLELADKTKIEVKPQQGEEMVEVSNLSNEEFNKLIQNV